MITSRKFYCEHEEEIVLGLMFYSMIFLAFGTGWCISSIINGYYEEGLIFLLIGLILYVILIYQLKGGRKK